MSELSTLEQELTELMEKDHRLCEMDDMSLYGAYISYKHPIVGGLTFEYAMRNRVALGMPAFESVTRIKRKIFEKREDLRPSEPVKRARAKRREEFEAYARE